MTNHHPQPNTTLPIMEEETLASATECTGLVPAAVQTPQEGEDYAQLYAIHLQKPAWKHEEGYTTNAPDSKHD